MAEPLYRRIADDLRQQVESGKLQPGRQLPTELELRELYDNASRNTIRDAIKWLITRGLVEARPGQGTFVGEKMDPLITTLSSAGVGGDLLSSAGLGDRDSAAYASQVTAQRRTPRTTDPRVEIQQAPGVIATELQLDEGSTVVSRHQQRFIDDRLWSLQTTFYPMRFVEQGASRLLQAANIQRGAVKYIADTLGIREVGYRDTITVRPPDMNETAAFKLPSDGRVAVVEILRTGFDDDGEPIRLTVTVFPADRNKFVINVGRIPGAGDGEAESDVRAAAAGERVPETADSAPADGARGRLRSVRGAKRAASGG